MKNFLGPKILSYYCILILLFFHRAAVLTGKVVTYITFFKWESSPIIFFINPLRTKRPPVGKHKKTISFLRRKLKLSTCCLFYRFHRIFHVESFRLRYTLSIKIFMLGTLIFLWKYRRKAVKVCFEDGWRTDQCK